ncbi:MULTISPECIES: YccJ family protein [unclassified Gilliamella]|uniref:YccJ family protein n=1 Tax=unclassified Gilliamella TaxID=2685620 RepID=UPI001C694FB1|nr:MULTISPECIES: YccJ family protein [unclassified Gilliamella]MCX8574812.1 YccJ family protein [Gilliamella sp. B3831]MCX8577200.1 YccJ family protein [Gilliamella sp. B3815]MCX8578600.1 YccJ family protein [Gilliamella sp. B2717]MCX8587231.1 YccJ family protein [Gilliamella sp. B3801]MCX8589538.1 YccJ family protein [Gilliamella sp. B3812]
MNQTKKEIHDLRSWAKIRETSLEIAEAIFELAHNDEKLAEQIWSEGSDEVLPLAFSKTKADRLFWGEQTIERKNI